MYVWVARKTTALSVIENKWLDARKCSLPSFLCISPTKMSGDLVCRAALIGVVCCAVCQRKTCCLYLAVLPRCTWYRLMFCQKKGAMTDITKYRGACSRYQSMDGVKGVEHAI